MAYGIVYVVLYTDDDQRDTIDGIFSTKELASEAIMRWVKNKQIELEDEINSKIVDITFSDSYARCGDDWSNESIIILEHKVDIL
jgi:hypothetical protein